MKRGWPARILARGGARRAACGAFTLLEMMLAVALVGLLMVGLNVFVFSMGEIWGKNTDKRLFSRHVRAVTRFLENELRQAALPPSTLAGKPAISPQEVRTAQSGSEPLLTFELLEGCHLFAWPTQPLPEVVCSLQVRDRTGLVLLWHSRLEMEFESDAPRETLISPWVTALSYDYYDADMKRWVTEYNLRRDIATGTYQAPQRLRLKFVYANLVQENVITLPIATEGLPNF